MNAPDTPGPAATAAAPPGNRLRAEASPYLRQHADNPVDWYPWGADAFARARETGRPIFLSIGYATCHWCHVMERESFADAATAEVLNRHFVAIKVDREERPDVDRLYMTFVQATTGGGGWPLSVWLTPALEPFYGGTYYPPSDRYGLPGFRTVLAQVAAAWERDRERVLQSAAGLLAHLRRQAAAPRPARGCPGVAELEACTHDLASGFDPEDGGFTPAPKFPRPAVLRFLLAESARGGASTPREMALVTLRRLAEGGVYDHLGGGFHRYAVDAQWRVPHFEKMLYDQAQLVVAYLEAFQVTGDAGYAEVARQTLGYVQRDLGAPEGGFYAAEDADSARPGQPGDLAEGAFYVWEEGEILAALGPRVGAGFNRHYGVRPEGNVARDPHGEFRRQNILRAEAPLEQTAAALGLSLAAAERMLREGRAALLAVRNQRPRPRRDDTVITAWNGLMISALSRAAQGLDEPGYLEAAVKTAEVLAARLYDPATRTLRRCWRGGRAGGPGFADDYAFLIQGLLDLYETGFDVRHLVWAVDLQAAQDDRFWDAARGGYYSTVADDPEVLVRLREDHDGAEPAAGSVAALNLLRLSEMVGLAHGRERAERTLTASAGLAARAPSAMPQMLMAAGFALQPALQIVVAGEPQADDTRALLRVVRAGYLPNRVVLLADGGPGQDWLAARLPHLRGLSRRDGRATAYLCRQGTCLPPLTDPEPLREALATPGAGGG